MNQDAVTKFMNMELTPAQKSFVVSNARFTMFGGGRGMGIGFALRRKLTEIALSEPGIKIAVYSTSMRNNYEIIGDPLMQSGIAKEKNAWPRGVVFENGSSISFLSGKTKQELYRYAALWFEVIAMMNAQENRENVMSYLRTMNRTARAGGVPMMLLTAHPGGVGHHWIKRLFIDKDYRTGEKASDFKFVKASMGDNPYLKDNEEYQRALGNVPDELRKSMLKAGWEPTDESTKGEST